MSSQPATQRRAHRIRPAFRIVSWNIGGAKFFELPKDPPEQPAKQGNEEDPLTREEYRQSLNENLRELTKTFKPHVILLQEAVRYGGDDPQQPPADLIDALPGYDYDISIAIDTVNQAHPQKWAKYYEPNEDGSVNWAPGTYLAQGYGILWRKELDRAAIWDFKAKQADHLEKEIVHLETGLFTGSRDTEPRLAVVSHFIINLNNQERDIFLINLHLTTLKGEREGSPKKDVDASEVRQGQLKMIVDGIVSRLNEWAPKKWKEEGMVRRPPVWVIGGDFNCMPTSPEIAMMERMNFIDLNPNKGDGTKGSGVPIQKATITLDYLFAGPAYYSLDPYLARRATLNNPLPLAQYCVSDHFPILADVPILPVNEE